MAYPSDVGRLAGGWFIALIACGSSGMGDVDGGVDGDVDGGRSLGFVETLDERDDFGVLGSIPAAVGAGEFTVELWLRPDDRFPFGPTGGGDQRTNWSSEDEPIYDDGDWWFRGNFLIDGHNNRDFSRGTFSLQFYGSGRLRWLFGDRGSVPPGGVWAVQGDVTANAPNLVDGAWHHVALVRRFAGAAGADLEMWIDGQLIDTETSDVRTDMNEFWSDWSEFPDGQPGWFFGAEKQAAIDVLAAYEDYKGLVSDFRALSLARSPARLADYRAAVTGAEPGVELFIPFAEGSGDRACDPFRASLCIELEGVAADAWTAEGPPTQ